MLRLIRALREVRLKTGARNEGGTVRKSREPKPREVMCGRSPLYEIGHHATGAKPDAEPMTAEPGGDADILRKNYLKASPANRPTF